MPEITEATRKNLTKLQEFHENEWKMVFDAVERGGRQLFLISEKDTIYGYVTLNFDPKYALYNRLSIPEIQDLYVAPEYRRQGFANLLIDHCEETAKLNGASQIGISVSVSPEFGIAQQIYIARGYNVDGNGVTYDREVIDHADNHMVDDSLCLMMMKDL